MAAMANMIIINTPTALFESKLQNSFNISAVNLTKTFTFLTAFCPTTKHFSISKQNSLIYGTGSSHLFSIKFL